MLEFLDWRDKGAGDVPVACVRLQKSVNHVSTYTVEDLLEKAPSLAPVKLTESLARAEASLTGNHTVEPMLTLLMKFKTKLRAKASVVSSVLLSRMTFEVCESYCRRVVKSF